MISRDALVNALVARRLSDWVVIERAQERAAITEGVRPLRRTEHRTRWTIVVHDDVPKGRGSARIEVDASEGDADEVVAQAGALARATVGPIWRSPPASAPAKVQLLDEAFAPGPLADFAAGVIARLRRPAGARVDLDLELMREHVTVQAHSGFRAAWSASTARARALVSIGERSLELQREARRVRDLELAPALATMARDVARLATAEAPSPGRCALILRADALLHGGGLGLWAVFADQASAALERQGLARYRVGAPVAPGAEEAAEPLTIRSDGALDFATRSAPVGEDGAAVRRFALIERGIAVGLGMSTREASRRGAEPNGGVRNLVVSPGTWTTALPTGRTLEVHRLRWLEIDPHTGDASFELALATERTEGGERVLTGGTVHLDLIGALARARRSAVIISRGAYVGPEAVLIEDAALRA